ncbi:MAG: polysaccharide deacetylase family protein [Candidatus Omnitrophica bacterium]|nr:polysaccharide deacetylase family protein [Candidatus Omnitrophota bacterium]
MAMDSLEMKNVLSVDWEAWYQTASMSGRPCPVDPLLYGLESATDKMLEALGKTRATFFVVAANAVEYPALVRRIAHAGHEIALHGAVHQNIGCFSPEQFERAIIRAKHAVEDIAGASVIGFRAPNWSIGTGTLWAMDILVKAGFKYDASMTAAVFSRVRGGIPAGILEIPRSGFGPLHLPYGGGAFLRVYPYALTRRLILNANAAGRSAVIYVHPWEIDHRWTEVRRLDWRPRCIMGFGCDGLRSKLVGLFREFQLGSFQDIFFSRSSV